MLYTILPVVRSAWHVHYYIERRRCSALFSLLLVAAHEEDGIMMCVSTHEDMMRPSIHESTSSLTSSGSVHDAMHDASYY